MNRLFYKEIIEKTNKHEIYFFFIHSGNFSNDFDSDYKYKIVVLNGSLRVISDDKKNEGYYSTNNIIETSCGEIFKLQNISTDTLKALIIKSNEVC
jgi:hypothetical protein|tara:strand:+ start:346 stop:633 length:288 start_codon:yes stop_codon:yes gene_type:complete